MQRKTKKEKVSQITGKMIEQKELEIGKQEIYFESIFGVWTINIHIQLTDLQAV